ncbi:hypothetical protein HYT84_02975 [Candidatus Micrarchaeota archaeon]|nr:hypothetical protein [Candidatus Micrarchaeota archaeon]
MTRQKRLGTDETRISKKGRVPGAQGSEKTRHLSDCNVLSVYQGNPSTDLWAGHIKDRLSGKIKEVTEFDCEGNSGHFPHSTLDNLTRTATGKDIIIFIFSATPEDVKDPLIDKVISKVEFSENERLLVGEQLKNMLANEPKR